MEPIYALKCPSQKQTSAKKAFTHKFYALCFGLFDGRLCQLDFFCFYTHLSSSLSPTRWPIRQLAARSLLQEEALPLHQIPDSGAGEGVSVQHVPHARPAAWGSARAQPDGAAGEDLVPEPQNENEETKQGPTQGLDPGGASPRTIQKTRSRFAEWPSYNPPTYFRRWVL